MPANIQYGDYEFVATPKGFVPISGFTTSTDYAVEETRKAGKMPSAKKGGYGLTPVGFTAEFLEVLGVSPWDEYEKLVNMSKSGAPRPLYMNGVAMGAYGFLLTGVSDDETIFGWDGRVTRMVVSLAFTEFTKKLTAAELKAQSKRSG